MQTTGHVSLDFIILVVYGWICGRTFIALYHWRNKHEQRRFVMMLQVLFPDAKMTYVSVSGTEAEALRVLKAKLEQGEDLSEDQDRTLG